MLFQKIILIFVLVYSSSVFSYFDVKNPPNGNHVFKDFQDTKNFLKKTHYLGQTKTFYCGCTMTKWNRFTNEDNSCQYKNQNFEKQWQNIEAEHIVPFSAMLKNTKAYQEGEDVCKGKKGRACAEKVYGFLSGDLWIVANPSEMELNRVHSNYQWTQLIPEEKARAETYGSCGFYFQKSNQSSQVSDRMKKIQEKLKKMRGEEDDSDDEESDTTNGPKVEPPDQVKGKIARAYLYVEAVYKINVLGNNRKVMEVWAKMPPTKDQCSLAKKIVEHQQNENEFEINACKKAGFW